MTVPVYCITLDPKGKRTQRAVNPIVASDKLAASGKTTTKISNRIPIFPVTVPGLTGAVIMVIRAMKRDSLLVRDRANPGTYYQIKGTA